MGILFHRDNAHALSVVVKLWLLVRDCGSEVVDYPPYSHDLVRTELCVPQLKKKTTTTTNTWLGKMYRTDYI